MYLMENTKVICSLNFICFKDKKTLYVGERRGKYTIGLSNALKNYPTCIGVETFYCYTKEQKENRMKQLGIY